MASAQKPMIKSFLMVIDWVFFQRLGTRHG
jgi:hypothetical protein